MVDNGRGVLPQIKSLTVGLGRTDFYDGPPVHALSAEPRCDSIGRIRLVPDGGELTTEEKVSCEHLRAISDVDTGPNGRRVVRFTTHNIRSVDPRHAYNYSVMAAQQHAYWFCVYKNALSDEELMSRRASPDPARRQMALSELSDKELVTAAKRCIIGLEMIPEHSERETYGYVMDYHLTPGGRDLYALIRPYESAQGRTFTQMVEAGSMRGCSLGHAVSGEWIQLHEISLCHLGARPGTKYMSTVLVAGEERLKLFPRIYTPPPFVIPVLAVAASCSAYSTSRGHTATEKPTRPGPARIEGRTSHVQIALKSFAGDPALQDFASSYLRHKSSRSTG